MTAPGAVPDGTTVDELAAALRAYHDVQPQRAAVELLIAHNQGSAHWLGREPFVECVSWLSGDDIHDDPAMAQVDWLSAKELLELGRGLHDTTSEQIVLALAVSIAIGPLSVAADTCDAHNRRLVAAAVAEALGLSWADVMTAAQA